MGFGKDGIIIRENIITLKVTMKLNVTKK